MGDLLARLPRSLLSPPVRGPVCVVSTQTPRPQGEQRGPQAAKTQPGLRTIAELGETIVAVGEQLPRFRPWCGIEHQAARTQARGTRRRPGAQPSATLFRAFGPSPLQGRRAAMQGRPAETSAVRRRRHTSTRSQDGKNGQCSPRTTLGARSLSVTSYSPSGTRGQKKRPHRPPANTDTARPRHASLHVQVKRGQDAFRPGNEPSEHGLGRVGQAPEPSTVVPRRGNERPKR